MTFASFLLANFRRPLLREIGLHLGLLAVLLQVGLAVLHVAPAVAGPQIEAAWCGTPAHTPDAPVEANARGVCPLCQLPPLGPAPDAAAVSILPVVWPAMPVVHAVDIDVPPAGHFARPAQPRGPPPSA